MAILKEGIFLPKRKVCANCHNPYHEEDRYCRYCGAPMGNPDFIDDDMGCIYGPPPLERTHKCAKCGFTWVTCQMIDRELYCPKCGGDAPVSLEKRQFGAPLPPDIIS